MSLFQMSSFIVLPIELPIELPIVLPIVLISTGQLGWPQQMRIRRIHACCLAMQCDIQGHLTDNRQYNTIGNTIGNSIGNSIKNRLLKKWHFKLNIK